MEFTYELHLIYHDNCMNKHLYSTMTLCKNVYLLETDSTQNYVRLKIILDRYWERRRTEFIEIFERTQVKYAWWHLQHNIGRESGKEPWNLSLESIAKEEELSDESAHLSYSLFGGNMNLPYCCLLQLKDTNDMEKQINMLNRKFTGKSCRVLPCGENNFITISTEKRLPFQKNSSIMRLEPMEYLSLVYRADKTALTALAFQVEYDEFTNYVQKQINRNELLNNEVSLVSGTFIVPNKINLIQEMLILVRNFDTKISLLNTYYSLRYDTSSYSTLGTFKQEDIVLEAELQAINKKEIVKIEVGKLHTYYEVELYRSTAHADSLPLSLS